MKRVQYKTFSWNTHAKNWRLKNPNVCQIELTFKCGLHCSHCYCDCYNKQEFTKKELSTAELKAVIDKLYELGVLWICFTGGDPLERKDFLEVYSYAKEKGFLVTIFSTGYSMTEEIADYLAKKPPFVIEITINGITKQTYEAITQVKGSFEKTMRGMDLILKNKLPLKVKTMATKQNLKELPKIKEFLEARKVKFRPSAILQARLNSDAGPCSLRLTMEEIRELDRMLGVESLKGDEEGAEVYNPHKKKEYKEKNKSRPKPIDNKRLFRCAIGGGDGINLDPYGKMFLCHSIRKPEIDFLNNSTGQIRKALFETFRSFSQLEYKSDSKCSNCDLVDICLSCPGKRFLETGDMEAPVEYFCKLAQAQAENFQAVTL